MQKLHLVGFTADFDGLIFSPRKGAKSGSFVVPIDGRLLKQLAEAERLRDGGAPGGGGGGAGRGEGPRPGMPRLVRPESSLSPREMQDRIRAGWSMEEVAGEAGVDLDWVSRFAAPVLAEVRQVVEQARELIFDKPRVGLSALPLGASVRRNVVDRGVRVADDEFDDCWSAYQLDEEAWVVRFAYLSRGRSQEAEWRLDLDTEDLTSRNRLASQLGHVPKGRARRVASVAPAPPKRPAGARPATPPAALPVPSPAPAAPSPTRRTAAPKAKSTAKGSKRPTVAKARATKSGARKAAASKVAAKKNPVRKVAGSKVASRKVAAKKAAPARRATPRSVSRKRAASRPAKKPAKGERAPELTELTDLRARPGSWVAAGSARRDVPAPGATMPVADTQARGPLPPPPPALVPPTVRDAVSHPIGEVPGPPRPGPAEIDEATGIARIDSRRTWHAEAAGNGSSSGGRRPPMFRGDVTRAGGGRDEPAPRRPRRTEPLRGR